MIYESTVESPIFRVTDVEQDRMRVILFDRRQNNYTLRWVPSRALAADDQDDLLKLQADPLHYAPDLAEIKLWLEEHPASGGMHH